MEIVKFSGVPLVDGPRFTTMQQCSENHCAVDLDLLCDYPCYAPHVFVQSTESNARLGQSSVHLVINHNVPGKKVLPRYVSLSTALSC